MAQLREVEVAAEPITVFGPLVGEDRYARLQHATAPRGRPAGFMRSDRTRGEVIRTATIGSEGQLEPVPGTGVLLDDPVDLDAFGDALAGLLERPTDMARLGDNARRHVLREFVGDRHLLQYAALIERLLAT